MMFTQGLSRARFISRRRPRLTRRHFESLERRDLLTAELVHDINTIRNDSDLPLQIGPVVTLGSAGYFVESSLSDGTNLYRTDGTTEGTTLVKQLTSEKLDIKNSFQATVANEQLFFTLQTPDSRLLWRSAGDAASTEVLATIGNGDLFAFNDQLYFNGSSTVNQTELWVSNGTVAGTQLVSYIGSNSSDLHGFAQVGEDLAFTHFDGGGYRSMVYDPATTSIALLQPNLSQTGSFVSFGSQLLFSGYTNADDEQLWITDGTPEGTLPFVDLLDGAEQASVLAVLDNDVLVAVSNASQLVIEIVHSESAPTVLLTRDAGSIVAATKVVNNKLLVSLTNGPQPELLLVDLNPSPPVLTAIEQSTDYFFPHLDEATYWNGAWYVPIGIDQTLPTTELHRVDYGDGMLTKLEDESEFGVVQQPLVFQNTLYWIDDSPYQSPAVRRSLVGELVESTSEIFASPAGVSFLTDVNGHLVFAGQTSEGIALRALDGLDVTTLSPERVGPTLDSLPPNLPTFTLGNRKYFFAAPDGGSYGLWRTDGTSAGTVLISNDIHVFYTPRFAAIDDTVFIVTTDSFDQLQIYRVDDPLDTTATERGVQVISTLEFGSVDVFFGVGNRLVLSNFAANSREFWSIDSAGVTSPITSLSDQQVIQEPVVVDGQAYFMAGDFSGSRSLWRSDGTDEGTMRVLTGSNANWRESTTDGRSIYWITESIPAQIWRSDDGLATQTFVGIDYVKSIAAQAGVLYYTRTIDGNYTEVFRTDGSIGGPERLADSDTELNLVPISDGMLIGPFNSFESPFLLASLGKPVSTPNAFNQFIPELLTNWGSPELGSVAVGPVGFERYGLEPGRVSLPAAITLSNQVIQENAPAGNVGRLSVAWFSSTEPIAYSLVTGLGADNNASFTITSDGNLVSLAPFDAELNTRLSIRVRASTIGQGTIAEQALTLSVRDLFDGIEFVELSNRTIPENSPLGAVVGTFSSETPPGVAVSYSLISVNGSTANLPLSIVGNQLRVASALDYESLRRLDVVVRATGSNGSVAEELFSVRIINVNENATAPIAISFDRIDENIGGTIGDLSVPGSSLEWTYSLVAGTGDYENSLFSLVGGQLVLNEFADYEVRDDYSIRVRAQSDATIIEAVITVVINPVDEFAPTDILLHYPEGPRNSLLLYENVPAGEVAATIEVIDRDRGEDYTFEGEIRRGNGDILAIASGNSLISIRPANFERDFDSYGFVTAVLNGVGIKSLTGSGPSITVIGDRNDPPLPVAPLLDLDVVAGETATYSLPPDVFIDEDLFGESVTLSATLGGGPLPAWLTFDPILREFTAAPLAANLGQYTVTVAATDGLGAVGTSSFLVTVLTGLYIDVTGTNGNDAITVSSTNAAGTAWSITRNGQVIYTGPFTITTPIRINGGVGTDQITVLAPTGTDNIVVSDSSVSLNGRRIIFDQVETQTINGRGGSDTFRLISSPNAAARNAITPGVNLLGGNGIDTLIASNANNQWTITDRGQGTLNTISFSGFENLQGGTADDQFSFGRRGDLAGTISGGAGLNSIDFSADNSATDVRVNDVSPTAGFINGVPFTNVQAIVASQSARGSVRGPASSLVSGADVDWQVSPSEVQLDYLMRLTGFETFEGSAANDHFVFQAGAALQRLIGGGGRNRLSLFGAADPIVVDLNDNTATGLSEFDDFTFIESLHAGAEVRGPNQNTTWRTYGSSNQIRTSQGIQLRGFESVVGGARNDIFELEVNSPTPQSINGGGGVDTLTTVRTTGESSIADWRLTGRGSGELFKQFNSQTTPFSNIENLAPGTGFDSITIGNTPSIQWFNSLDGSNSQLQIFYGDENPNVSLEVNLQNHTSNGFGSWSNVPQFLTTLLNSKIIGRNTDVNWQIDLSGGVSDGITGATGFRTLVAGSRDDYFNFSVSGQGTNNTYPVNLQGGGGVNWLDFSLVSLFPINVDLQNGTASFFNSIAGFVNVIGSQAGGVLTGNALDNILIGLGGQDVLIGLGGNDVLLGGGGNDQLEGGAGRDLLIGGSGADLLFGGSGEDILIADLVPSLIDESSLQGLNKTAVAAVMAEWTSNRSYSQRIARLRSGVGPGQTVRLTNSTVLSDGAPDILFGEAGDDWFWSEFDDMVADLNSSRERVR